MVPSQLSEFGDNDLVRSFCSEQVDMLVLDVRAMLKLPHPEIEPNVGCNLTAASTLCDLLSGVSVIFYAPSTRVREQERRSFDAALDKETNIQYAQRFKEMLKECYPWLPSETPDTDTDFLFEKVRGPLTHSLGLWQGRQFKVLAEKNPLSEGEISELETLLTRPNWVPATLRTEGDDYIVSVAALYWGFFQVLRRLASNTTHMAATVENLQKNRWQPNTT